MALYTSCRSVFLAHTADFNLQPSSITIMCMAVVLRPKRSGQLYAFYTGTIYDTYIFQLCTQHCSTTFLGVLGI